MNPGIGIMTVPSRLELTNSLVKKLEEQGVQPYVSIDEDMKGTWFNWKRTAKLIQSNNHSHALILQDDVILCKDFYQEYKKLLDLDSTNPICLFTAFPIKRGFYIQNYVASGQGISMPIHLLDELFNWHENNYKPEWGGDDDFRLNYWCKYTGNHFRYHIPTLIDHNINIETTLGPNHIMQAQGSPWNSKDFIGV